MDHTHTLRGMATLNIWADDVTAARDWYAGLFGIDAYYQVPDATTPAYVEFRIGDDEDEFGIIDRRYAPAAMQPGPGGAILHWHVDDIEATFARLLTLGATEYEHVTPRGDSGFITASVIDPFGNVLGIMQNPHWAARHPSQHRASPVSAG